MTLVRIRHALTHGIHSLQEVGNFEHEISRTYRRYFYRYALTPTPHFDLPLEECVLYCGKPILPPDHPDHDAWLKVCAKKCRPLRDPHAMVRLLSLHDIHLRMYFSRRMTSQWDIHTRKVASFDYYEVAVDLLWGALPSAGICPVHDDHDHHCVLRKNPAFNWQLMAGLLKITNKALVRNPFSEVDTGKVHLDDLARTLVYSHLRKLDWTRHTGTRTVAQPAEGGSLQNTEDKRA
eukprot:CAMPEP_0178752038 /NCGR_PEP_ID=MMETSP0744-20121128/10846_1 /TAXON_ID=913974 /ORGANISM="Nitzschia punctata, Strain CCMP561" /LENGTH=234 /DNA_ID=CAMNT_0020405723 /DNA_START=67 /DNA_END=771 /DNA_ORIENTATION=+